jgi:putative peptide zinc metalloprotease protein
VGIEASLTGWPVVTPSAFSQTRRRVSGMTVMNPPMSVDTVPDGFDEPAGALGVWPTLLDGTELVGQREGSGLREPPFLVRRRDGQLIELSRLLYVIAQFMDGRALGEIAKSAATRLEVRVTAEQVAYVAQEKLAPLGLVTYRDGRVPALRRRDALLALKFRVGVVPERAVNALASLMKPLFAPPVVIAALLALAACDVWLRMSHGIGEGLGAVIQSPALILGLTGMTFVSLAFHECGHAAACRYGGARPGRIGIGIYLVWPVFFTDVTDSYRLSKAGRLRTDLGGVYFNVLFALAAAGVYLATAYKPLLIVVVGQQLLILDQFAPWIRLDGYHIVSDLIGVSDLFGRIKPVVKSLLPGRPLDPRVAELKRWARVAVTTWVLGTVTAITGTAFLVIGHAAGYLKRAWESLIVQVDAVGTGARLGNVVDVVNGAISTLMLLLPVAGISLTYLLLCRGIGRSLALHRARVDATLSGPDGRDGACLAPARAHQRLGVDR